MGNVFNIFDGPIDARGAMFGRGNIVNHSPAGPSDDGDEDCGPCEDCGHFHNPDEPHLADGPCGDYRCCIN